MSEKADVVFAIIQAQRYLIPHVVRYTLYHNTNLLIVVYWHHHGTFGCGNYQGGPASYSEARAVCCGYSGLHEGREKVV